MHVVNNLFHAVDDQADVAGSAVDFVFEGIQDFVQKINFIFDTFGNPANIFDNSNEIIEEPAGKGGKNDGASRKGDKKKIPGSIKHKIILIS